MTYADHTKLHTHPTGLRWMSDQLVAEVAICTKHNKHTRRTTMPSAGIDLAIPEIKRLKIARLPVSARPYIWKPRFRPWNLLFDICKQRFWETCCFHPKVLRKLIPKLIRNVDSYQKIRCDILEDMCLVLSVTKLSTAYLFLSPKTCYYTRHVTEY
jgi:hypothetical protein